MAPPAKNFVNMGQLGNERLEYFKNFSVVHNQRNCMIAWCILDPTYARSVAKNNPRMHKGHTDVESFKSVFWGYDFHLLLLHLWSALILHLSQNHLKLYIILKLVDF